MSVCDAALSMLVLGALAGCAPESTCGPSTGTVSFVVDGDTFELESGVRVRVLLADAPETTSGKNDCYGEEAKRYTIGLIAGKKVELSYDELGCTDKFGRTLAYVKVDGVELNSELVKRGLACTLFIAPSGTSRSDEFATYQSEAQTDRTGMWGACTDIPCSK